MIRGEPENTRRLLDQAASIVRKLYPIVRELPISRRTVNDEFCAPVRHQLRRPGWREGLPQRTSFLAQVSPRRIHCRRERNRTTHARLLDSSVARRGLSVCARRTYPEGEPQTRARDFAETPARLERAHTPSGSLSVIAHATAWIKVEGADRGERENARKNGRAGQRRGETRASQSARTVFSLEAARELISAGFRVPRSGFKPKLWIVRPRRLRRSGARRRDERDNSQPSD